MLDTLGDVATVAGGFLGIVYAIGLIIVTIHMNRYGITHIYLVQVRYIVVGFAYLVHVLGLGIMSAPVAAALVLLLGPDQSGYIAGPIGVLGLVFLIGASFAPLAFEKRMTRLLKSKVAKRRYWRFWYITVFCGFVLLCQSLMRSVVYADTFTAVAAAALSIAVVFSGIVYYTIFLYQDPITVGNPVLELIGSGRPITIRLTVDRNRIAGLQQYGMFAPQADLSEPMLLLDETNEDFLILVDFEGKERAVKISKKIVDSIVYLP